MIPTPSDGTFLFSHNSSWKILLKFKKHWLNWDFSIMIKAYYFISILSLKYHMITINEELVWYKLI